MNSRSTYAPVNKLLQFQVPDRFSKGVGARLPEAYKKFWNEWKKQQPEAVHYIPEPGKWKRNPDTGEVSPVQNIPIPVMFPEESKKGLWGGEGVIIGFVKRDPEKRRVPHYWFPNLVRSVVYSEVLNKHMSVVVTQRTLDLIHKNYGLDHYILKTPACDLQSELALKLKRKILLALFKNDLYPEDATRKEEMYNKYKQYLENYTEEEIDWYGLNFSEAVKKLKTIESEQNKPVPLKQAYRAQLLEKLQEAGVDGVHAAVDEHDVPVSGKTSWITKMNPFSSRKQD